MTDGSDRYWLNFAESLTYSVAILNLHVSPCAVARLFTEIVCTLPVSFETEKKIRHNASGVISSYGDWAGGQTDPNEVREVISRCQKSQKK